MPLYGSFKYGSGTKYGLLVILIKFVNILDKFFFHTLPDKFRFGNVADTFVFEEKPDRLTFRVIPDEIIFINKEA